MDVRFCNVSGQKFFYGAYRVKIGSSAQDFLLFYPVPYKQLRQPVILRLNSACLTGDLFGGDKRCDCRWQLDFAKEYISREKNGIILYALGEDGMGNGVVVKLKAYRIMDERNVGVKKAFQIARAVPEQRQYHAEAEILKDLGFSKVRLLTNNPHKIRGLEREGIDVVERIPIIAKRRGLKKYLHWKKDDFGHML